MSQSALFTSGLELASSVVNSNLLHLSLAAISATLLQPEVNPFQDQQSFYLRIRVDEQANFTIVALVISPSCTVHHLQQGGGDLVKQENFPLFEFLCSQGNPSFSIHRAAIALFYQHFEDLSQLKDKLVDSRSGKILVNTPLIITGNSVGGSVASLFTLWLLDSIHQSSSKRPLCITFGSPLITGDLGFQKAVSERSTWNSCFLNVVANQDPVPSLFIPPLIPQSLASASQTVLYRPFGAFLLCSELGCTCVDDPEVVTHLLGAMSLESRRSRVPDEHFLNYYGAIVENLKTRLILRSSLLGVSVQDSLQAGIILQLEAIGDKRIQQQQHNKDIADLIKELEQREKICMINKRKFLNPSRKLNEIKIKMAYLEWYKKTCKAKNIGYYDSYKNLLSTYDREVTKHKKFLTKYWEDMVQEAEKKPCKEGSNIRLTWLFAGTNYRRMIEPLDIAEYYRVNGNRNYENQGRSKHYILLEKWAKEVANKNPVTARPSNKKKQNVAGNLTEDSCFWAKVEEALISCELFKDSTTSIMDKQLSRDYLVEFEAYVMEQIQNYAVSPEIFLAESSFMKWWREFQDIASNSSVIDFMKNGKYVQYNNGCF